MLEKNDDGMFSIICDHCGEWLDLYTHDFHIAIKTATEAGWISKKIDEETWLNFCDLKCVRGYKAKVAEERQSSHKKNIKDRQNK